MDALSPVYATLGTLMAPVLCVVILVRYLPIVRRLAEPTRSQLVRAVRVCGGFVLLVCLGAGIAATVIAVTQPRADAPAGAKHRVRFGQRAEVTVPASARSAA